MHPQEMYLVPAGWAGGVTVGIPWQHLSTAHGVCTSELLTQWIILCYGTILCFIEQPAAFSPSTHEALAVLTLPQNQAIQCYLHIFPFVP